MLEKTFDPKTVEPRLYAMWEASGAFAPNGEGKPFSIVIPPPNVTGSLHIGHALNNTLQDVLARFHRMKGDAVLWLPGTDHAGIATQMVVERQLAAQGNIGRREMGREAFVAKVWEWKGESGGTIVRQLRRLGASCDWSRERFTLDDGLSAAVRKVFVGLYKDGLIYRDKRLVNWHPELQTAISDLEVENVEVAGHMWRFRYPLADGVTYQHPVVFDEAGKATEWETRDYIVVATTRPETMLGDTAVAVNPADERYKVLVGKEVVLPLVGRRIPIVADDYADPTKGTGAVKITPAHDFNDFQVGKRQNLAVINVFTPEARINEVAPEVYRGLDRFDARKQIVADIEALGLLDGIESHKLMMPFDEKSKAVVIEPYLTDQWYVDAAALAKPAIEAVEQKRTTIQPQNWEKTYFEWLRNIEPWCISRQLWWGHRIPAWFGHVKRDPNGSNFLAARDQPEIFVAETEAEAIAEAEKFFGGGGVVVVQDAMEAEKFAFSELLKPEPDRCWPIYRDEDVLDTWFSSALWPFSTLGWPGDTAGDLKRFYPTSVLITAGDIIFFWVTRMMMMGLHFMGEVPFEKVFLNALVLDEKGQKMSKVKGNVIDPLDLIDRYGADALRFTMVAITSETRHIRLAPQRVEGYRNFGTKLWNAARFCQMNECVRDESFDPAAVKLTLNKWIRGEALKTSEAVTAALTACAYDEVANALYRFIWNVFCDWYVELAKPVLNGADEAAKAETRCMTAWTLDVALRLLHPVMPFLTEELWDKTAEFGPKRDGMLMTAPWPVLPADYADAKAEAEIDWLTSLIGEVRTLKAEMNVPGSARPLLTLTAANTETLRRMELYRDLIVSIGRLSDVREAASPAAGSASFVLGEATAALGVAAFIDLAAERARLAKEIASLDGEIERNGRKLANPDYLARAKEEVVEETREKLSDAQDAKAKLTASLARLEGVA